MKFPITTALIPTEVEGVFVRPDYEVPIFPPGTNDVDIARIFLREGLCDKDGKALEEPKRLGTAQAREIAGCFFNALPDMGKLGSAPTESS